MPPVRRILAMDTALNGCGVALFDMLENVCVREERAMTRGHSEELMPMILRVMRAGGVEFADVDLLAVTVGPGAFTGLRIGLATAQGLSLALSRPVVGVTTLEAITQAYLRQHWLEKDQILAVILDTKRADFYVQFFDAADHAASEPLALSAAELSARLQDRTAVCVGDGAERFLREAGAPPSCKFAAEFERPDAEMIARIAADRYGHAAKGDEFPLPQPLYLRLPDVSVSKQKLRTLAADGLRDA